MNLNMRVIAFFSILCCILVFGQSAFSDGGRGRSGGYSVAEPTLGFFYEIARRQVGNPKVQFDLLTVDPRSPGGVLKHLDFNFDRYEHDIFEEGYRPLILFSRLEDDPIARARRLRLPIDRWYPEAPPAMMLGPSLKMLVMFEAPLTPRPLPVNMLLLQRPGTGFPASRLLDDRLYSVNPSTWSRAVEVIHTRCGDPQHEARLVTKLTYEGGRTDSLETPISQGQWTTCRLGSFSDLRSVVVRQPSRPIARRPVIIASSYFEDRWGKPSPLFSKIVDVD